VKALFVHREASLASARVRVLGLVPHLRARGVACELAAFPSGALSLRRLLAGTDADVVVLQKKTPNAVAGLAWRGCRAPIVFDYDDAIGQRQTPRRGSWESATRRRRFERALRLADAFTCGNETLASSCRAWAKPVLVVPSPVPLDVPRRSPGPPSRPARIGWIGAPGNLAELESIAPALRRLGRTRDFVLVVISEHSLRLEGVRIEHLPWRLEVQEEQIAGLDVGVMPLADSPWARGKCAYKLLQYMAAELPVVASPVGMNREVVSHAENGLLAETPDDWAHALEALLGDEALARRLGAAGRRSVEADYGYSVVADRWAAFLRTHFV
jgi:glycosyltransferase involved in cell wall biosynthesis